MFWVRSTSHWQIPDRPPEAGGDRQRFCASQPLCWAAPRPRRYPIGRTNRHSATLTDAEHRARPTPWTASVSSSTAC